MNGQEAGSDQTGRAWQYLAADEQIGRTVCVGCDGENRVLEAALGMLRHPGLQEALQEVSGDVLALHIKGRMWYPSNLNV